MPISSIDGCEESHWLDVKDILTEAIETADFEAHLVSDADEAGIIQKRIIQNLYENPIVVCDVSGKNPNVMFELGLRLAFDKPTIIVKDDKTSYSFDTSSIEHLEYPRDLRFAQIVAFKAELSQKIKATYKKSAEDADYTTFLKHFGKFTVPKIETQEVSRENFLLEEMKQLREEIRSVNNYTRHSIAPGVVRSNRILCLHDTSDEISDKIGIEVSKIPGIGTIRPRRMSSDHHHLSFDEPVTPAKRSQAIAVARSISPNSKVRMI